jgi:pimeloyl-ACP methyl ester carboxylesterase/predicted glycosyltransferase
MPVLDRNGVPIAWETHGSGAPAVLLLPPWSIAPSRFWKLQVPYLARHHRVITFDGRGNGRSGRPRRAEDYADEEFVGDALAVLDAAGVEAAIVVGFSMAAGWGVQLAAAHPERVLGLVALAPAVPLLGPVRLPPEHRPWEQDLGGFLAAFYAQFLSEPHSTRQIEDGVEWGHEAGPETLTLTMAAPGLTPETAPEVCRAVRCPVLCLHGDGDRIIPHRFAVAFAELTGAPLVTVEGAGHALPARHPVLANRLIREFAAPAAPPSRWTRALTRPRRALYVSSPIGLGHVRRDLAIAAELRARVPELEIDWLAQEPTRAVLEAAGERVHPLSDDLLGEAAHVDAWAGDHELWVFECIRRMDEIQAANYMVFRDLTRAEPYDLWIGDEAWEIDHFLHENPEDKRAPFVWLTDFVGWLPLPEHGEREAALAADLNTEMVEHVERFPYVRDLALFVGDPEDAVEDPLGPGLPSVREWTGRHFTFVGQVARAVEPLADGGPPLCVATAGGSAAGATLLRAAAQSLPLLRERVPDARMLIVAGPRVDTAVLGSDDGVRVERYVPDLDRRLAGCDVALTHGGLTTGMELVAGGRPFVSVPLRRHFEQLRHVRHRLARHGHERVLEADDATPERLAEALAGALAAPPVYRPVTGDGAARAAALIAGLL